MIEEGRVNEFKLEQMGNYDQQADLSMMKDPSDIMTDRKASV